VAPALQDQFAFVRKMNADVGAVDLLFDDQRLVGNEPDGLGFAQVLVVIGPLGAEQVRRPGVLDQIAM
jgi:hypothetical protein